MAQANGKAEYLPHLGTHLSVSKGYLRAGQNALSIGANTFAMFLRNPRGSKAKALKEGDIEALAALCAENHFAPLVAHAPYTMNLASENDDNRAFSAGMLAEDLERMALLPGNYYNLHPGAFQPKEAASYEEALEAAAARVASELNGAMTANMPTTVLLEAMAGGESVLGRRFAHLKAIIGHLRHKQHIGVCVDTCHLFAAGYDVKDNLNGVLEEFDREVGLCYLKAVHLNDSLFPLGSGKDRHAVVGGGEIGLDALVRVMLHPKLCHLSFITETPLDDAGHGEEISLIRKTYAKMAKIV